jgi:beta-glucosidase-like glycosyl hydrolase
LSHTHYHLDLGNCVGQTGSVPRLGINGLCLQDSPVGVRLTDGNSVFPAGVNTAATWSRGLAYARGRAMGQEHHDKGVDIQLGPVAGPLGRRFEKSVCKNKSIEPNIML